MKDWKVKVKEPKDFVKGYDKGYQQATADFIKMIDECADHRGIINADELKQMLVKK